ncbi:MAG TPA: HAMP domain-containing sensor histidine kinase [Thermoanaerobaculia bacterium]|nr:HAMP domain-containing sensor histidine kinase [Thermoanaerobaculia bacterium]
MLVLLSQRTALLTLLALAVSSALIFYFFERRLSRSWFAFGVHPEVVAAVELSRDDQKRLARLDPGGEAGYHRRFQETQRLLGRLRVLEYNRREIVRRYELALLAVVTTIIVLSGSVTALRQARQERRLTRLQSALGDLAAGRPDVRVGERGRDLIRRIAGMVEEASRRMTRDRRRLASLENLSAWQESARRHAHEIRTPLAAARLELARMNDLAGAHPSAAARAELARLQESLGQELDRLGTFTQRFASFARLPQPTLVRHDLARLVAELVDLFAAAWPELDVRFVHPSRVVEAMVDPEMLRQVLVNLGDNSALALREAGRRGTLNLAFAGVEQGVALDVADDGPGIANELRDRLFEPYTTSRRIGEGMGLGLAISRKVLLDHGGDLELLSTSAAGTTFRLLFPRPQGEGAE